MNKRIEELAIQAGAGEWGDSVVPATMDIEKFAELIVLDCAYIADQNFSLGVPTGQFMKNILVLNDDYT